MKRLRVAGGIRYLASRTTCSLQQQQPQCFAVESSQTYVLPWVEPRPELMASAMALKWCGCQVLPPPHRASGARTATRLLPGEVKGVPGWGHARVWGSSVRRPPSRSSTGCCSGAAESGHPGHPPLPGHGSTGLPCAFNPVLAAIAAVVVHVGGVMIG